MKTLKKALILMMMSVASFQPHAGVNGGGNGGSGVEAQIVTVKNEIESIMGKIENFAVNNPEEMEKTFPEVNVEELLNKIDTVQVFVMDQKLIDKDGVSRTCLNFPVENQIVCNLDFLELKEGAAKFVLVFHELLGLTGDEVNSFEISNKISDFVSKQTEYGLKLINNNPYSKMLIVDS